MSHSYPGYIQEELRQIWCRGVRDFLMDVWNLLDFLTLSLFVATIALRVVGYFQAQQALLQGAQAEPRWWWNGYDPLLAAECLFACANVLSVLKFVKVFIISRHLGSFQMVLGRLIINIMKFFCFYAMVLFAFGCGLSQVLWYYAAVWEKQCIQNPSQEMCYNKGEFWRKYDIDIAHY